MDTITIKVSDLYERACELHEDKMDLVEISISEASLDSDDPLPAALNFYARKNNSEFSECYDEIEAFSE